MTAAEQAFAVRRGAGLFVLAHRGVVEVSGEDATRWLNGMLSNDIQALEVGGEGAGCYALLLNHRAGIIADLSVVRREQSYWLELEAAAVPRVLEHLDKFIVADDVVLADHSAAWLRLGLEGPAAPRILAAAVGCSAEQLPVARAAMETHIGGANAVTAAWGWSGEAAYQFFVPAAESAVLAEGLRAAAGPGELVEADESALEILRVEAGVPRLGVELDEDVLPDEARLDEAVSDTKGCYTGQEIVARVRSRGQVNHLLVGLRFPGETAPSPEAELRDESRRVGEVTSVACSPDVGWVGLGFVRRTHAEPGTELQAAGQRARVVELPFVRPGA